MNTTNGLAKATFTISLIFTVSLIASFFGRSFLPMSFIVFINQLVLPGIAIIVILSIVALVQIVRKKEKGLILVLFGLLFPAIYFLLGIIIASIVISSSF